MDCTDARRRGVTFVLPGLGRAGITLERFPEEPRRDSAKVVLGGELQGT